MTSTKSLPPFRLPESGAFASPTSRTSVIEWSFASRPAPRETVSGDLHLVHAWSEGVLIAVIDGIGHGEEATAAAKIAVSTLAEHAGQAVTTLVQHCHRALRNTRGAVMTLASLDAREQTLSVVGVGNVETILLRANPRLTPRRESVLLRGGVVGYQLPALQLAVLPIAIDDVVVFATDGVREDFGDLLKVEDALPLTVERVITQKFRGTDDGLVLACKYVGRA